MVPKEREETAQKGRPVNNGMAGIVTADSLNWGVTNTPSTAKNIERQHNMFETIHNLMGTYNINRKIAVMVYRYAKGIDTLSDVVLALVRRNPISWKYETSMTEWMYFRMTLQKEGFEIHHPERKIEKEGEQFVFAS